MTFSLSSPSRFSREFTGSLRIDDFRATAPLGHLIVPRRRPVEISIYDSQLRRRLCATGKFSRRFGSLFLSFEKAGCLNQTA